MSESQSPSREFSFGQNYNPTLIDRFGVWLSAVKIKAFTPDFKGLRVGDFGCGYNAQFYRTVVGKIGSGTLIDVAISPELKAMENTKCLEGDAIESLKAVPSNSLDVIMCISCLEHLEDPQLALSEFHRVLDKGGICLLNVPSWWGKFFLEFSAFKLGTSPADEMDDHKMYYDKRDLWPLLVKAGFKPSKIKIQYHKFLLNTFAACEKSH